MSGELAVFVPGVEWDDPHIRQLVKNCKETATDLQLTIHAKGGVTIELFSTLVETRCNECA